LKWGAEVLSTSNQKKRGEMRRRGKRSNACNMPKYPGILRRAFRNMTA